STAHARSPVPWELARSAGSTSLGVDGRRIGGRLMQKNLLALGGALVGGAVGYFAFFWIAQQGVYGLVLPGGLLGLGAGIVQNRSSWVAVACGLWPSPWGYSPSTALPRLRMTTAWATSSLMCWTYGRLHC